MMSESYFYCSELSRKVAEKIYGTASTGEVWLLLEYVTAWGPRALEDSNLSSEIKTHLGRTVKNIPRSRVLFIRHDRIPKNHFSFYVVRCRESAPFIVHFKLSSYAQLLEIDIASVAAGNSLAGGALRNGPLYLVCTHGRRDKCCAKFGYPLYKSLREHYSREQLWQSSHVGGDRFAGNLICFPHGLFYGHMTPESGLFIMSEYEQGRIVLDRYRGRATYPSPVQAAEFFIRQESGLDRIEDLRQLNCARLNERAWQVRFLSTHDGSLHEAKISTHASEFQNYITCHATEEKSVIQYLLEDYHVINDHTLMPA